MDIFKKYIVEDFVGKYLSGKTPSPCVLCNQFMKFNFLLRRALELGADYLATGHYARIETEEGTGKFYLNKALDKSKDQSYFLFTLAQEELKRIMFPLGSMTKDEVREVAKSMNLKVADKPDSQEVCFITGGDYRDFLKEYTEKKRERGKIVDVAGNVLAYHDGVHSFTVGQRRGLGIAKGKPMYVVRVEPETNRVVVGEEKDIFRSSLIANNISWADGIPSDEIEVKAKIRYRHKEEDAVVKVDSDREALVEFKTPQRAMTPGQAIVFYKKERVLGGGWINEVL
jgi:tRNA-specific 2-thiouridylase